MATLAELTRLDTTLTTRSLRHLQRLVQWWGLLSDISFSDLLLFAPLSSGRKVVVADQIRPFTSKTLYREDIVGGIFDDVERPLVARCLRLGEMVEGELQLPSGGTRARVMCIPIVHDDRTIAVLARESPPRAARVLGQLELTYLAIFDRFARMIAEGQFPFRTEDTEPDRLPRVGDGVLQLDRDGRIEYASPNALSTLHRLGVPGEVEGRMLRELGLEQSVVRNALRNAMPTSGEVSQGSGDDGLSVQVVAVPLLAGLQLTGAVVLLRDVTEVRRRDRLLISKDATIREIHHRVKNNLQTISALLRLQARRLDNPEAKEVLEESVRRIQAISLVHETLSHEAGEDIDLREVVTQLVRIVEEGLMSPDRPIRFVVRGDVGIVPAVVVTPLAVVLNELLQNVVDHAFPEDRAPGEDGCVGTVTIGLERTADSLTMSIHDDGAGPPSGLDPERHQGLGLSIINTLVTTELQGSFDISSGGAAGGTRVDVVVPVDPGAAK